MNSVHFIMDFYGFQCVLFLIKRNNSVRYVYDPYFSVSFFFFFTRNSRKFSDFSNIILLLNCETGIYLGLLTPNIGFSYTLEELLYLTFSYNYTCCLNLVSDIIGINLIVQFFQQSYRKQFQAICNSVMHISGQNNGR